MYSHVRPRGVAPSGSAGRSAAHGRVRSPRSPVALRAPALVASGILVGGLTLGSVMAEQASPSSSLPGLLRPGSAVLVDRSDLAHGLSELRLADALQDAGTDELLAIAPDGARAAVASQVGPDPAVLAIVQKGGGEVQVPMPGLIGAAFAPDGSWLAVIDGDGSMWRVAADGSRVQRTADGPFLGQPIVQPDGALVTLRVSSVEAPIQSRLVRIGPDGSISQLADDDLVYGAQLLADGTIAYASHRGERLLMMQIARGRAQQLADLGPDAIHAQLSPQADAVAFERSGGVFVQPVAGGSATFVGNGARPRFAPDGRAILVEQVGGSVLFSRSGGALAGMASQAGFAPCGAECEQ